MKSGMIGAMNLKEQLEVANEGEAAYEGIEAVNGAEDPEEAPEAHCPCCARDAEDESEESLMASLRSAAGERENIRLSVLALASDLDAVTTRDVDGAVAELRDFAATVEKP